ncbi:MAG: ribosome maturation factor RimP [bacterium]
MAAQDVAARVWTAAEPVAAALGLEIVEVEDAAERKRRVIRIYIDKPGGVGLADCERLSRELAERLEEADVITSRHVLEVSSPGLERPLRKAADFHRFRGSRVRVRLRGADGGRSRITGVLRGIEGGLVTVDTDEGAGRTFPLDEVRKANLEVDWGTAIRDGGGVPPAEAGPSEDGGMDR